MNEEEMMMTQTIAKRDEAYLPGQTPLLVDMQRAWLEAGAGERYRTLY